ncbi:MAG TPA: hypothetical protein PLZ43_11530, partial [bacterium]|nr:hypothetical protein [bacterium]
MKKTFILMILVIPALFFSCTKDEDTILDNESFHDGEVSADSDILPADSDTVKNDKENQTDDISVQDDDSEETPDEGNHSVTCIPGTRVCNPSDKYSIYECNAEGDGLNET